MVTKIRNGMLCSDGETPESVPATVKTKGYQFERHNLSVSRILSEGYIKEELSKVPGLGNTLGLTVRDSYISNLAKHMVLELTGWILRDKHEHEVVHKSEEITINVPETWWDMLKQDHFPKWWLKLWPVRTVGLSKKAYFEYEQQIRVCPHANVAWPDDRHLGFLTFEPVLPREAGGFTGVWGPNPTDSVVNCPSCGVGRDTDGDGDCALCGPMKKRKKPDDFDEMLDDLGPERPAKYEG